MQNPLTQMQQDYQAFFNTTKPGSYTDFAGGVLYRAPVDTTARDAQGNIPQQNRAIFYTPQGQEYTLTDKTDLNAIAYTIPEIAAEWKKQYGFTPTGQAPASGVMTNDNWNPIRGAYADANRDPYATKRGMVFDPQLRAVDLSGYQNNPQGAFEKLAREVYGGKGLALKDISRLNDAVGGVGAYVPDAENSGTYNLTYADDISRSPYALGSVPAQGLTFDQRVALEDEQQEFGMNKTSTFAPSYQQGGMIGPGGMPDMGGMGNMGVGVNPQTVGQGGAMSPQVMEMQVNQFASQHPQQVAQIRAAMMEVMQTGELTQQELNMIVQLATVAAQNPEMYPYVRKFAIQNGIATEQDLPQQYDQGLVFVLLLAARAIQADVGGQNMMQGGSPAMAGGPEISAAQVSSGAIPSMARGGMTPDSKKPDGSVLINAHEGEYVIPANVVKMKGKEFFDSLVEKYKA